MDAFQNQEKRFGPYPFDNDAFRPLWAGTWDGSLNFNNINDINDDDVKVFRYELRIQGNLPPTLFKNNQPISTQDSHAIRVLKLLMVAKCAGANEGHDYLTHDQIFKATWGLALFDNERNPKTRHDRVYQEITLLREKLGDRPKDNTGKRSRILSAERGLGYRFLLEVECPSLGLDQSSIVQPFGAPRPMSSLDSNLGPVLLGDLTTSHKSSQAHLPEFQYIGMGLRALDHVTDRVRHARKIEDTTVRWTDAKSQYGEMQGYVAALGASKAEFVSVTGPVQDTSYVNALQRVYATRRARGDGSAEQLKCFRLHHASPLMNFVLIYENGEPRPTEVIFGFGTHQREQTDEETPVFRSSNQNLIEEFARLFKALRSPDFSDPIDINDPEFLLSREPDCDVLVTFDEGFPHNEIKRRIRDCQEKKIVICTAGWPTFDAFKGDLKLALEQDSSIELAFWKANSAFVKVRRKSLGKSKDAMGTIKANQITLREFKGSDKDSFRVLWCKSQASVTIFWIGDLIYFSLYWAGTNASSGPHFLVHAESKTGKIIQEQYKAMVLDAEVWSPA